MVEVILAANRAIITDDDAVHDFAFIGNRVVVADNRTINVTRVPYRIVMPQYACTDGASRANSHIVADDGWTHNGHTCPNLHVVANDHRAMDVRVSGDVGIVTHPQIGTYLAAW